MSERQTLLWAQIKEWLGRNSVSLKAGGAYVLFSMALVGLTLGLIFGTNFGETTRTKTEVTTEDGAAEQRVETTEKSQSLPIELLIGVLGFGGALVLPLKYFWDELSNRAESRRQVAMDTRARLHAYIERFYIPILYALQDLTVESEKWVEELSRTKAKKSVRNEMIFDRWLYSFAQVWRTRRDMRDEGGSWFFRSRAGEKQVYDACEELRRLFDKSWEKDGWERSLLASALHDLKPRAFITFRAYLVRNPMQLWTPERWRRLRNFRDSVLSQCSEEDRTEDFRSIADAARHTATLVRHHATEIYGAWYKDGTTPERMKDVLAAQRWLEQVRG